MISCPATHVDDLDRFLSLYDGMSDFTDAAGGFTLNDVPFGSHQLTASKVVDGVYYLKKINVTLLYEGTSESTNDLDGTASISFNVPVDQTVGGYTKVVNTQEDEGDTYGELTLSVKNARNNN